MAAPPQPQGDPPRRPKLIRPSIYEVRKKSWFSNTKHIYNSAGVLVYAKEKPRRLDGIVHFKQADSPTVLWEIPAYRKRSLSDADGHSALSHLTSPFDPPGFVPPSKPTRLLRPMVNHFDNQMYQRPASFPLQKDHNRMVVVTKHFRWLTFKFFFMWNHEEYYWKTNIALRCFRCMRRANHQVVAEFHRNIWFGLTQGHLSVYGGRRMTPQFKEFLMVSFINIFEQLVDHQVESFGW
ncbi:hypothetical protein H4R35_006077 [Dimargaris xerosporica]|nr:hypothetical protein H4R35_006077 [Dimargaris xerosporica]